MNKLTKKKVRELAERMMKKQRGLKDAQLAYERMVRLQYQLPKPLSDIPWIKLSVDASPYNAIRGAKLALSNIEPAITIKPVTVLGALDDDVEDYEEEARIEANVWEQAIKRIIGQASGRKAALRRDATHSAVVYDEINAQIIHIPTHAKLTGMSNPRLEAAKRMGDWAYRFVDPKTVYAEYSDFMLERVLYVNLRTKQELLELWGDKANKLPNDPELLFGEFDYVDYDQRYVWCTEGTHANPNPKKVYEILKPQPWMTDTKGNPVPFLNWITSAGGTTIDAEPEHQRQPILYPVYRAEQWAISNIMNTLLTSTAIAESGRARQILKGFGIEDVDIDFLEPGGRIELAPHQDYQIAQAIGLDPQMMQAVSGVEEAIRRSTVADVLITGSPISGEQAFASFNLQVQQAIASLGGVRDVIETWMENFIKTMLLMSYYRGYDIEAYGDKLDKYVIDSEHINPDAIEVHVEVKADSPVDRQQRVMSAIQIHGSGIPYSPLRLLEFLGETDPEGAMQEFYISQVEAADWAGWTEKIRMDASGELQAMIQQALQQAMEAMQAQQQNAPQNQGPMGQMANPQMGPPGVEGLGGPMADPNISGNVPAQSFPGATRELQGEGTG